MTSGIAVSGATTGHGVASLHQRFDAHQLLAEPSAGMKVRELLFA